MKYWLIPLFLGFGVTLAYIIGTHMSQDAMAVVLGVAVGVVAAIPISAVAIAVMRRQAQAYQPQAQYNPYPYQAPMILQLPAQPPAQPPAYEQPLSRKQVQGYPDQLDYPDQLAVPQAPPLATPGYRIVR